MISCKLTHSLIIALTLLAFTACLDDSSSSSAPSDNPDSSASDSSSSNSNSSDSGKSGTNDTFNKDIKYGTFTDKRDNQQYKTVTIGTQTWMAENMRYVPNKSGDNGATVFSPYVIEDCERYSRFFDKATLEDKCPDKMYWVGTEDILGKDPALYKEFRNEYDEEMDENSQVYGQLYSEEVINDICPEGWHLPSNDDWQLLKDYVEITSLDSAGTVLRSKSKWDIEGKYDVPGKDSFGFNILPATTYFFSTEGRKYAYFWSSSKHKPVPGSDSTCQTIWKTYNQSFEKRCTLFSLDYSAIRCIKDADNVEFGTVTDSRDNKKYNTVKIGEQTWMAENLNFETEKSYCPEDDCNSNSRLYTWSAAKEACPDGYYLPNDTDWNKLFETVGGVATAASTLKASDDWPGGRRGTAYYGFAMTPSSFRSNDQIKKTRYFAFFWSSSESGNDASYWFATDFKNRFMHATNKKDVAYPVRCIKGTFKSSAADTTTPAYADPSRTILGKFIDERDGHEYATTTIGSQTWMEENLNLDIYDGMCYDCEKEKYGYHYFWSGAVDSVGRYSNDAKGCGYGVKCNIPQKIRGICPDGWHLPTLKEWRTFRDALEGAPFAYAQIKTLDITPIGTRTELDYFGFDFIRVGYKVADPPDTTYLGREGFYGKFMDNDRTYYWAADEIDETQAYAIDLESYFLYTDEEYTPQESKRLGGSVRCLKD